MRALFIAMAALAFALGACRKDEVDLAALTSNPFDAAYNGPPVFELTSAITDTVIISGEPVTRFRMSVRVVVERLPRVSPYYMVRYSFDGETPIVKTEAQLINHSFSYSKLNVLPGQQCCVALELGNSNVFVSHGAICATVQ